MDISNLLKTTSDKLVLLKSDRDKKKNTLKAIFESDKNWKEQEVELSKVKNLKKYRELEIIQDKNLKSIVEDISDMNLEIKECKVALNDYISIYLKDNGGNEIEIDGKKIKVITKYSINSKQLQLF